MKHLTTALLLVLLTLYAVTAQAQNKPASRSSLLFANFPNTISFTEAQLNNLFRYSQGENVSLAFENNVTLSGPVTSNLVKYSNLQTVVINLTAYSNTLFSLSKQTENNHTIFVGRIFNPAYADGFELQRNANGNYQLTKIDTKNTLTDCTQ
jgi:hypothetical protein